MATTQYRTTPSGFPISQAFARQLGGAVRFDIVDLLKRAFSTAVRVAGDEATKEAKAMATAMDNYRRGGGGSRALASANTKIAQEMQAAVLAAYDSSVDQSHPYRVGDRYSGGALRRALANPDMFVATYSGINFINASILDREAAHWARLNFGAAPGIGADDSPFAPRAAPGPVRLELFGQPLGAIVPFGSQRGSFGIPPGVWVGSAGASGRAIQWGSRPAGFYPTRSAPKRATKGIGARQFFAPAYEVLAEQFPVQYGNVLREIADQAVKTGKGLLKSSIIEAQSIARFIS